MPWLEDIVQKAYRLGLEPYSWDLNRFIEDELELETDPFEFDGGMPGTAATFLYAFGLEEDQAEIEAKAKTVFARLANALKPDTKNLYEDTTLYFVGFEDGATRWSRLFESWSTEKLDRFHEWLIDYDYIEAIETSVGPVEVFWTEEDIDNIRREFEEEE